MSRRWTAVLTAALAASLAHGTSAATPEPRGNAVGAVIEVAARDWPVTVAAEGVVEAVRQTTLGAQVAGRIVALDVKAGDTVRAGQVLARIDARTADQAVAASRSQVAEAQANLANAKRKYERNRDLLAQKFVSQAALDQAEAEYKAAQAQLAAVVANEGQAVAAQSFTTIVAPYAGVIGATQAELGDMAQPGKPLLTIFDPRELRVAATVPQAALATIKLDAPVRVEIAAIDRTLTATKVTIIPLADARTHTARVRLDLPEGEKLLPGQFARAYFATGTARAIAVPATALLKRGEVTAVYVVDRDGRPQLRQVRVGESLGDRQVEILAGLSAGERIAANPVQAGMAPAVAAR
ncbi:MAG TPA: efflux RND transporter periplasmic adaptor subunit [Casimicrobiaceae bacterium]|nr:efflux RND transporter periplasmic adaptor subunit [Casimicrobiaceae bacterium]